MLILKSPLALQSISPISTYSDRLGAKLSSNYQVIGTNITAADLIYMTMQEPDIYIGMQSSGTLVVENSFNPSNHLKLELVNQLINRIMLYDSEQFTYQDEVFITSILHKLGINDVNQFMQQIKMHMDRNKLLTEMINKYFEYSMDISETINRLMQNAKYELSESELRLIKNQYNGDLYLHNEIFERLETAECNNTIYDYSNSIRTEATVLKSISEAAWIEQADAIHLARLRQSLYYQTSPSMWREYLVYEASPLLPQELSESNITNRVSAAVLENIIQKLSYEETQAPYINRNILKNYVSILYGSAADVIERFKYYQSYEALEGSEISVYNQSMAELYKDELQLADLLYLTNIYESPNENEDLSVEIKRNILLSVWENQNLQKQLTENLRIYERKTAGDIINNVYQDEERSYLSELHEKEENYLLLRHKDNNKFLSVSEESISEAAGYLTNIYNYTKSLAMRSGQIQPHNIQLDYENNKNNKNNINNIIIEEQLQNIENITEDIDSLKNAVVQNEQTNYITEFVNKYSDIEFDPNIPIMQNIELLERINRHNIYMKEKLDSINIAHNNAPKRIVVDRIQAMRNALRALESPQELRQEIYENAAAIERELPVEIERILSITDENTQNFYRQLLGYQSEGYLETNTNNEDVEQILSNLNNAVDTFNDNARQGNNRQYTNQPQNQLQNDSDANRSLYQELQKEIYILLHRIESREHEFKLREKYIEKRTHKLVNNAQIVTYQQELLDNSIRNIIPLEHISMDENTRNTVTEAYQDSMRLVHTTKENIREELVDEIVQNIERDVNFRINTSEQVNENFVTEKQLQEIKQELIKQSEEKITQVINQNFRSQVHSISDMVYLELERRLKNEQRRRGY